MNNCLFFGLSRIFLLEILSFKGLIASSLYKSFGVKGLTGGAHIGSGTAFGQGNSVLLCLNHPISAAQS
jgi:hypothetical protein